MKLKILLLVITALSLKNLEAQPATTYAKDIETWHAKRIHDLKAADGWLNLVGLYWLEEGRSSFGSGKDNTIVFPAGTIGASAGFFQRSGDTVKLIVTGNTKVTIDGKPTREAVIFNKDSSRQPAVATGNLRFTIIKRGDKLGIRLRDLNSPMLTAFTDIDRYPLDTSWRITAVLQQPEAAHNIAITNIIGQTSQLHSPGKLVFTIGNTRYTLDALEEDNQLFIVFADATTGRTTYPSGRFLLVPKPTDNSNSTVIDFNKAYNPPCAFTHYATCPLPPKENVLPIEIEAGEKVITTTHASN